MELPVIFRKAGNKLVEKSPIIFTGLAVGGVVTTCIFSGRASIKAYEILKDAEAERSKDGNDEELSVKEKAKLIWKPYIPVAISGLSTIGCIIIASTVQQKRHAALMGLYSLTEAGFREYKDKVAEIVGEKKSQVIKEEIIGDHISRIEKPSEEGIIRTGHGNTLCFDVMTGRYFYSDIEKIRRVQNDLNHDLIKIMWVPLNDFYYALGLEGIKIGEEIGWDIDHLIDINLVPRLTDDNEPAVAIDYDVMPKFHKNYWD